MNAEIEYLTSCRGQNPIYSPENFYFLVWLDVLRAPSRPSVIVNGQFLPRVVVPVNSPAIAVAQPKAPLKLRIT